METTLNVQFSKEKETKGTWRFKEDTEPGERGIVGSIYVLKSELEKLGNPQSILVMITAIAP